jgi:hypothetical protein
MDTQIPNNNEEEIIDITIIKGNNNDDKTLNQTNYQELELIRKSNG